MSLACTEFEIVDVAFRRKHVSNTQTIDRVLEPSPACTAEEGDRCRRRPERSVLPNGSCLGSAPTLAYRDASAEPPRPLHPLESRSALQLLQQFGHFGPLAIISEVAGERVV